MTWLKPKESWMNIYKDGVKIWRNKKGVIHRKGKPAVVGPNGLKKWVVNGSYHRKDGPAIEYADGDKFWYLNGLYHREDGPAMEWADGHKEWWLNNECLSEEQWKEKLGK